MNLSKHYKIVEFLEDEFNKLKAEATDNKSNFYKQKKHINKRRPSSSTAGLTRLDRIAARLVLGFGGLSSAFANRPQSKLP